MTSRNHWRALTLAAIVMLLVGCYDVNVRVAPLLQGSTVRVDLVGVNSLEQGQFENLKEYWDPGNGLRRNARSGGMVYEMTFPTDEPATEQVLSRTDKIWDDWKRNKVQWIYVIADIPAGCRHLYIARDPEGNPKVIYVSIEPEKGPTIIPPPTKQRE